jgi:hypothetical protein
VVGVGAIGPEFVELVSGPRRWSIVPTTMSTPNAHGEAEVHEICTYPMPFADELSLWDELEMRHVGLLAQKSRRTAATTPRKRSEAHITATTTVITAAFDLSESASWDVTRAALRSAVDLAAEVGGCVHFTSRRRHGHRTFDALTDALATAFAPRLGYAADDDVRPISTVVRSDVCFLHTVRDGLDVAAGAGIGRAMQSASAIVEEVLP